MGIDAYGLVRQPDGTLGQTTSEEARAAIAQILSGHPGLYPIQWRKRSENSVH